MDPVTPDHSGRTITVVVVDDDSLVRCGLRLILGGDAGLEVVGEAADGAAGADLVARVRPDVVLMDVRMPRCDGLEGTRRIVAARGSADRPRVLVLTTFDADDLVLGALRAGAGGFLLKDTPPAELVAAIHAVAGGEPTLSPSVTALLMATVSAGDDGRRRGAVRRLSTLTPREREVAVAVGRGRSNHEIARDLHLSIPTVKAHVSRLFDKLGCDNRVQVAILVHEAGATPGDT